MAAATKTVARSASPRVRGSGRAKLAVAKRRKTLALQTALLEHGAEPAMILAILGLMGASSTVRIRRGPCDAFDEAAVAPEVLAVFDKYRPRFAGCLDKSADLRRGLRIRYWEPQCQERALEVLCAMPPREMHELFAAFIASSLNSSAGGEPGLEDAPLAAALAPELSPDVSRHCPIDRAFLEACRKPFLLQLACALGLDGDSTQKSTVAALRKLKATDLRRTILRHVKAHPDAQDRLPDTLRPDGQKPVATTGRG